MGDDIERESWNEVGNRVIQVISGSLSCLGGGLEPARGEIWLEDDLTDRIQSQPLDLRRR